MDDIASKIKYLQGLAEGLNLSDQTPEGKIIHGILEALENLLRKIEEIENRQREFNEFVELFLEAGDEMDNFMSFLESNLGDLPFDLDDSPFMFDDDSDEEDEIIDIRCSDCGRRFFADIEDVVNGTAECPSCGRNFNFADLSNYFSEAEDEND